LNGHVGGQWNRMEVAQLAVDSTQYWKLINWMKCLLHMELSVEGSAAMHFVKLLDADFF
jgi:hypothetical protein